MQLPYKLTTAATWRPHVAALPQSPSWDVVPADFHQVCSMHFFVPLAAIFTAMFRVLSWSTEPVARLMRSPFYMSLVAWLPKW